MGADTASVRSIPIMVAAAVLATGTVAPAEAVSARIGGPCKKIHQVDWIKGVRAQCTWVKLAVPKKKQTGKLVWKALPPAQLTATRAELSLPPAPGPSPSVETPTTTESATGTAANG